MTEQQEFGKWRAFFWPIHAYELEKIIPMLLMFFFITFNYTILRDTKESLLITAAGAEALPFIKVWGTVPAAIIFMLVYSKLANILSRETIFYLTISMFLTFFVFFVMVLYPNRDILHPQRFADELKNFLPLGLGGFAECVRNWTYSLFDVMAELWGSMVLGLLFWGFANDITKVSEAKRFYALFGIGANISLLVSGPATIAFSDIRRSTPPGVDAWQISLNYLILFVVLAGFAIMAIYFWIHRYLLTNPKFYNPEEIKKREEKPKLSLTESLLYLAKSKYILCIAALVISYGICMNLIEVTWKAQLRAQFPHPNDFNTFMGYFSTITGIVTIFMMLFVGGNALRKSWKLAAMLTPCVLLVTGTAFFCFVLYKDTLSVYTMAFGTTPLWLAVIFGTIQNVLSKSSKYSLFDPSKETAYIPLDPDSRLKGKAVIDLVGSRLGKSGGSLIQQFLLLCCGTLAAIIPYIAVILFVFIGLWLLAANSLSKQFLQLTSKKMD
jgi:ATP:ADP antiporter, AAA family